MFYVVVCLTQGCHIDTLLPFSEIWEYLKSSSIVQCGTKKMVVLEACFLKVSLFYVRFECLVVKVQENFNIFLAN